jgi:hypothetical protein
MLFRCKKPTNVNKTKILRNNLSSEQEDNGSLVLIIDN